LHCSISGPAHSGYRVNAGADYRWKALGLNMGVQCQRFSSQSFAQAEINIAYAF
jgi:hypothetical protein